MNREEPIWVTGQGTANPLGHDYATVAENILAGKSGIRPITDLDLDEQSSKIAGRFDPVPVPHGWAAEAFARLDPMHQLILWCTTEALRDAGYWDQLGDLRVGLVLGL